MFSNMGNTLQCYFLADLSGKLPGSEYHWTYEEDGSYSRENTHLWIYPNRDDLGFYSVGVYLIYKGVEYHHWVKAPILLSEEEENRMVREIRWSMFHVFSMDELAKIERRYWSPVYPVDKEPVLMNKDK
jgi:hypothetical protein